MKTIINNPKRLVHLTVIGLALTVSSCLSPKFANQISAKDDYPGEYFENDTFSVTIKNTKDKMTTIRVIDRETGHESLKMDIGPLEEATILIKSTDLVLSTKMASLEYKVELTGE